jgi:trk system potassium uptake protein TrkH
MVRKEADSVSRSDAAGGIWNTFKGHIRSLHPAQIVLLGYLSYIVFGWIILCLPFSQKEPGVSSLDNLFITTSALSTTGLVTVSVADRYTFFGQLVILILIQMGGVGYMTFGSFVILSRKATFSEVRAEIGQTVFSLPAGFRIDKFIRSVIVFTFLIELAGAVALYFLLGSLGVPSALWGAVFHSVSAFCTAGFSLYNTSFEGFADQFWLNFVIACLSYLGAIGFIVCVDFWRMVIGKVKKITLTSKVILWATIWLSVAGTLLLFLGEPTLRDKPLDKRLLAAFFQAMTSMTTVGFNTIPIGQLSRASLLLVIVLMVIGASPSGTGGGLKSTTFTAILGVMRSAIRGEKEVRFWKQKVPLERVWTAVAGLGFYITALLAGAYFLEMTESFSFDKIFFEAASALGTVGLSTGITADLSNTGKMIITLLMFCGRLGPLTFGMALFLRRPAEDPGGVHDLAV